MPGKVVEVLCKDGDVVTSGQHILVIEAMKIRNAIAAPDAGTVSGLGVSVGDSVQEQQVLLSITS